MCRAESKIVWSAVSKSTMNVGAKTPIYNTTVESRNQPLGLKYQNLETVISTLSHKLITILSKISILRYNQYSNQIWLYSNSEKLKEYKDQLTQLVK